MKVVPSSHQPQKLSQSHVLYDQLVYPLIFWTKAGGRGITESERLQGSATLIRKVLIAVILQPHDHFIHQLGTLREEFICAVYRRSIKLDIKYLAQAQRRCFAREGDIRDENSDGVPKGYALRTFIPPSLVDGDDYCYDVDIKCFAISKQMARPKSSSRSQ
jgi:hypothetical protein